MFLHNFEESRVAEIRLHKNLCFIPHPQNCFYDSKLKKDKHF